MSFETLPVVHLVEGRFPEYPDADPERALSQLAKRFGRIALVDAEGIRRNQPDVAFIQRASRRRALWVDAGPRYAADAMDVLVAGAESATLRWNTLRDAKELEEASQLAQPGALFLGLEYPHGRFLENPRDARGPDALVELAHGLGLGVVFLVDGMGLDGLRALPPSTAPRWVQGVPRASLDALQDMGFQGALLAPAEIPAEATA